jgi:predicted MFS family arabinose efflux permease
MSVETKPDAGRASAWLPVAGAALTIALLYTTVFTVPPLIAHFVDDFGLSHAEAGALMSVSLAALLLTSAVSGRLTTRFGPSRVMLAGLALCGAASICFPLTGSLTVWLLCRAATGIAAGLIYAPGITFVTSLLPVTKANLGIGVYLCGLASGVTVAFFTTPLLEDALDWRWPFWIFGAAALAGTAVFARLAGRGTDGTQHEWSGRATPLRTLLRHPPFRIVLAGAFVGMFVTYGVYTWIAPYLDESAGFSTGQISFALSVMTLAGIPGTLGAGWLAYRTRRPLAVSISGFALTASLLVLALSASPPLAVAAFVPAVCALGVSLGMSPLYGIPPAMFGPTEAGTASGVTTSVAMTGAVTSTYAGGWIVGAAGYDIAFVVYVVAASAAATLLVPALAVSMRRSRRNARTRTHAASPSGAAH